MCLEFRNQSEENGPFKERTGGRWRRGTRFQWWGHVSFLAVVKSMTSVNTIKAEISVIIFSCFIQQCYAKKIFSKGICKRKAKLAFLKGGRNDGFNSLYLRWSWKLIICCRVGWKLFYFKTQLDTDALGFIDLSRFQIGKLIRIHNHLI